MYVYRQTKPAIYTVGIWNPNGTWEAESDYTTRDEAAARVSFLNGFTDYERRIHTLEVLVAKCVPSTGGPS